MAIWCDVYTVVVDGDDPHVSKTGRQADNEQLAEGFEKHLSPPSFSLPIIHVAWSEHKTLVKSSPHVFSECPPSPSATSFLHPERINTHTHIYTQIYTKKTTRNKTFFNVASIEHNSVVQSNRTSPPCGSFDDLISEYGETLTKCLETYTQPGW